MTDDEMKVKTVAARLKGQKLSLAEICRDDIVEGIVRSTRPIPIFRALYISSIEQATQALGHPSPYGKNATFELLRLYHYKGYFSIPRQIRRRIPDMIREVLNGGGQ